ncbi:MAG: hypothetical protein ACR2H3_05865, partial [Acidimicrobiales bacterium]
MTAVLVKLRPAALPLGVAAALSVAAAIGLAVAGLGWSALGLAALAGVIAATLLVDVDLPRGGVVPLGHAVVLAGVEMLAWDRFVAVGAVGLLIAYPVARHRDGPTSAMIRIGGTGVAMAAAALVAQVLQLLPLDNLEPDMRVLVFVFLCGVAFFLADFVVRGRMLAQPADRIGASPAGAVYLTLM